MPTPAPRTLADQLRGWSDEQVVVLLQARPDLATPTPQDSSQLASRMGTRASVQGAVDQLTRLELTVLDAALALGGTASRTALGEAVHATPEHTDAAVDRLTALGLLWGEDEQLRTVGVLTDLLGTRLSGLGPSVSSLLSAYGPARVTELVRQVGLAPSGNRHDDVAAVAAALSDGARVEKLCGEVDDQARAILDHLEREGRDGLVESTERSTSHGSDRGPVDQLLERGLLVARDRKHVAVPREVAICLRAGHTTRAPADRPPELALAERGQNLVDRTAAGAAFELVRRVELLLEHWGATPPSALRSGGLGVRDLRVAAELLHLDRRQAALHVEVAAAAHLLAVGHGHEGESLWLPTDAFDLWTSGTVAERWTRLALAWLESPRLTGLVGGKERDKTVNALAPDLERRWLPETRRTALAELAAVPEGSVLAAGTGVASLVERMAWLRPRRPAARAAAVSWAVEESAVIGAGALGGLASHGRALLSPEPAPAVVEALGPLLPSPVDHVLVQADLTAVAPGPLEQELARHLATLADVESRGGATVYRFTEASVRRAFDAGWSVGEVHDFVASASRTPVPQALSYLVDDVSRRFGTVRVGAAESFLRSDDETALAALLHDPQADSLRLRRIAPTVLVSDVPVDVLLPRLRDLGTAPVVEAPDGTVRLARREVLRSRTPRPVRETDQGLAPGLSDRPRDARAATRLASRVSSTVTAIRAGDRAAATRPAPALRAAEPTTPASAMAALREAVEAGSSVWLAYVDKHGSTVERVVEPVKVDAGWLSAYDGRTEDVRTFAISRISAVRVLDG